MSRSANSIHICVFSSLILLLALPSPSAASGNRSPAFSARSAGSGPSTKPVDAVDRWRTRAFLTDQSRGARDRIIELEQQLESVDDKDEKDDIEDSLEILEFVEKWATRTLESNPTEKDIMSANVQINRILEGIDNPVEDEKYPSLPNLLHDALWLRILGHPVPNLSPRRQQRPLGLSKARNESAFLYDPADRSFLTAQEMAGMTPEEISRLDVSSDHPAWYREEDFNRIRNGLLKSFDQWLENGMTTVLRDDDDLEKDETYDIHEARKVLFLKDIYFSATSPKGTVEDAFGVDWKLKWGDETHVEPIASRLYLLAGAKITDGNFVCGFGPEAMTLILAEDGSYEEKNGKPAAGDEREPETVDQLKQSVLDFYEVDITPYIHSHGIITESNAASVLRHLPANGKKKYRGKNLIGRRWIAFRESMVELKPKKLIRRIDDSRMSDPAAINDRAARGNYLFNLWIASRDAKDNNYKGFFLKEPAGEKMKLKIRSYREGQHDLGYALGSVWSAGAVNHFSTGRKFARRGLFGGKIRFDLSLVFKPRAWDAATWADTKWMARKITAMTEGEIREAVAYSHWPDFMQEALVYKLIDRRNRIGEFFDLTGQLDRYPAAPPDMTVPLGNDVEIQNTERRYGLVAGSLKKELASLGTGPGYRESILSKGQIAGWKKSALVRLLIRQRYPSGLDDRYNRTLDSHPGAVESE